MTSGMYVTLADLFKEAAEDERIRVVLWAWRRRFVLCGQRCGDFLKILRGPGASPQAQLMNALADFDKPLVAAVQGAASRGRTTMLLRTVDFVYAGGERKFQKPFIKLAVVPEFDRAGLFGEDRAHSCGGIDFVGTAFRCQARCGPRHRYASRVRSEASADATETARTLAAKPAGALQASKRLMKQPFREQIKAQ